MPLVAGFYQAGFAQKFQWSFASAIQIEEAVSLIILTFLALAIYAFLYEPGGLDRLKVVAAAPSKI